MASEMTLGEIEESAATIQGFNAIKREAVNHLSFGLECFTVSAGPWTLTFNKKKIRDAESIKIGGVEYDIIEVERPFNCAECDLWNQENADCKFEKESLGLICPAAICGRRLVFKRRNAK